MAIYDYDHVGNFGSTTGATVCSPQLVYLQQIVLSCCSLKTFFAFRGDILLLKPYIDEVTWIYWCFVVCYICSPILFTTNAPTPLLCIIVLL